MIHSVRFTCVLDTIVIYPIEIRDILFWFASYDLFTPKWSNHIFSEWEDVMRRKDISEEEIKKRVGKAQLAFPDALVDNYEPLVESLTLPDENDRHVLAAAIKTNANIIVTNNVKDFPAEYLASFGLTVKNADDFITDTIDLNNDVALEAFRMMVMNRTNPDLNEFETRKLQYERSRNNLATLRQHYDHTKLELETNYQQSQNALAQAQTQLSDYSVTSKMDGRVYSVEKEAGEMILQQETLARIGAADEYVIEMAIDEVDVARVSVGLQAIITLDAYPDQTFSAEITKIYPQKNVRTQTFKVEGVFTEPPTVLYSGMSGEANIIIHQKQNTLTIPIEYFANGKVMTENGEVEVETGIQTMQQIEIISGIDSTTVLYKP